MPRGRPKRHLTAEAKAEAKRKHNHEQYLRRKNRQFQRETRPDFIHYAPAPPGVPSITPPDLGLRISADIPVPRQPLLQLDELLEDEDAYRLPSPLALLAEDDIKAAAVINQLRTSEEEQINERTVYEKRILQQINKTDARAANILLEMQTGIAHTPALADKVPEHSRDAERPSGQDRDSNSNAAGQSQVVENNQLQRSSTTPVAEEPAVVDNPPVMNTRSVSYKSTPTLAKTANASTEALNSLQTPSQRSSISSTRSSIRGSRRKTPFPAQSNTLLSWISPAPRQPFEDNSVLRPAQLSCIYSTSQPLLPSSNRSTPQPVTQGTPAAASPSPFTRAGSVPSPGAAQIASPAQSKPRTGSPPTPPTERTAYKLAKQLRNFQGCTHEEHTEADRRHQEHHQRPDIHSACSSFEEITRLLRGVHNGGAPLPDVLSNPKLMQPSVLPVGLDLKAAFEGTSLTAFPEDVGTPNEKLPRNLCPQQHHQSSRKGRAAKVRFDIDSVCCFPSSLAFARNGIDWHPRAHPILNLDADIHFSLTVSAYNNCGVLATKNLPLHKIPHYCFGSVAGSTKSLLIFIFFPELHLES